MLTEPAGELSGEGWFQGDRGPRWAIRRRGGARVDPDLLVLDLGLPGLDGVEVCRQVRAFSDAYVVILTARSDEVDKLIGLSVAPTTT